MQSAGDKEPEALATCPYDPAHRLPRFRMKRHLVKCRLNSTANEIMVICPLNNEHRIPQPEFAFHMETCSSRIDLDRKIQLPEVVDRVTPIQTVEISSANDECWDDAAYPTYDPTKHVTENAILRVKNCEPKAKRREFRLDERNRIARLNEENQYLAAASKAPQGREMRASASGTAAQNRRPITQSAAMANKPNLDPYKVNDILKALNEDQQKLLDSLQRMGERETVHIFPIDESAQYSGERNEVEQETFSENEFPSLGGVGSKSNVSHNVGRGGYAATLQGSRGPKK